MIFLLTFDRFETIHNVSASQLEVLVTWCFPIYHLSSCFLGISREGKRHMTKTSS